MAYLISLVARNEGVRYVDESGVYRFDVSLANGVWIIYLPGSFDDSYELRSLSDEDRNRIISRVAEYLRGIRWLGLFKRTYEVQVVERTEPPLGK